MNEEYEIQLALSRLISGYFAKSDKRPTPSNIRKLLNGALKVMHDSGGIAHDEFKPVTKLKLNQLSLYKLYKNINRYQEQWYMKIIRNKKEVLITGSVFSGYRFRDSQVVSDKAVFIEFDTDVE